MEKGGLFSGTLTQLLAATSGTLFAISDGMTYSWTAPMIPYLISEKSHIKTTRYEAEWLETVLMTGAFCGLPLTSYLVDKIGRRKSMLFATLISFSAWVAIALANKMLYIFIARFFFGIASNMSFVACPMYIAEIADHRIRGFLATIIYMMMLLGLVIAYSVGPYCPFYVIPVIGCVVLLIEMCVFYRMPESPYYLIYKNRHQEAYESLKFFRPMREIDREIKGITKAIERQKREHGSFRDILTVKNNRKAIIIMFVLNSGQHMCAISVILMNLHLILEAGESVYMDSNIVAIIFAVIMLISAQIASLQVDKHGRKALLIISTALAGCCLLALAIYFNLKLAKYDVKNASWIPLAAVLVYAAAFKHGLGIVPIVITAEIFSANIKAIGMTISDAWYIVGSIVSLQLYQWLSHTYGLHAPFYLFFGFSVFILLFVIFYLPETKGKTLEEIQILLKGELYSSHSSNEHSCKSNGYANKRSYNTFENSS